MLSKSNIKWINSLERKKFRDEENVFVAEGIKIVSDLLPFLKCRFLAVTDESLIPTFRKYKETIEVVSKEEYRKITFQKSPQGVLAVFKKPQVDINIDEVVENLSLVLDDVQDPGNVGTIIRIADWFGIRDVFCSPCTADVYSMKAVQSTMGALARVRVHYLDLPPFLNQLKKRIPIYGTFMSGDNIYEADCVNKAMIVLGNEGNGISDEIYPCLTNKIKIPSFPPDASTSESLNVSTAAAITISEFRRRY